MKSLFKVLDVPSKLQIRKTNLSSYFSVSGNIDLCLLKCFTWAQPVLVFYYHSYHLDESILKVVHILITIIFLLIVSLSSYLLLIF